MEHNRELELAWEYVEHTGISIFLTGKAGTGKTTFLRTLRQKSAKAMIVVAPTGVAAINAGGATIHSFFQLPLSPYVPDSEYRDKFNFSRDKLRIIRALDLLVIDEISMVRADLLDAIDNALRKYRRNPAPFGGVQLLMIGDLQQLAPVVTPADEALLRPHYATNYFFGSKALAQTPYVTIALQKVYRQQNQRFIELLNNVRNNTLQPADLSLLTSRLSPGFIPPPDSDFIRLTTHNHSADSYNASRLNALRQPEVTFNAKISGAFPEYSYPTAQTLRLKVGAQVMFVRNDPSGNRQYFNGKIGHVVAVTPHNVSVLCPGESEPIEVSPQTWENARYTVDDVTRQISTEILGTFEQMPLRLAWAITIHKSQGLTFEHVIIDAGASFAPGQVYVALSRCKTLEGIVLATPISASTLSSDPTVSTYIERQDEEAARSIGTLDRIKQDYHRAMLQDLFSFSRLLTIQTSITGLLAQTFAHSFPSTLADQQQINNRLRSDILDIADKWIQQLAGTDFHALVSAPLLERVKKSAKYFSDTLLDIFGTSLKDLASVRTGDKKATQRMAELTADLRTRLQFHLSLLSHMSVTDFSVPAYLKLKLQASLGQADVPQKSTARRQAAEQRKAEREARKQAEKEARAKARAERVPSHEQTYRMFQLGMTREEIAQQRGLAISTISTHLENYILSGHLTAADILTPALYNAIVSAIELAGEGATMTDIRLFIPEASFADIKLAVAQIKNNL